MSVVRDGFVKQGLAIAALPCAEHIQRMEKISTEIKRLGGEVTETTGVVHIDQIKRRHTWALVAKLGAALVAAGHGRWVRFSAGTRAGWTS